MLNKLKKNDNKGFTIIEVMIVLAIAGLIILIVLLAVPALQRNGRNTAIKNDVSAIAAGIAEFSSNNEGKTPAAANITASGSTVTIGASPDTPATAKVQAGTVIGTAPTLPGNIQVLSGKCTSSTAHTVTANARSSAILYSIETASATAPRCIDA